MGAFSACRAIPWTFHLSQLIFSATDRFRPEADLCINRRDMDTRTLLPFLETPFGSYAGPTPAREVVLAGLQYPLDYWVELAVAWLEGGAEIDGEIVERLNEITLARRYHQRTRHRAGHLLKLWKQNTAQ